MGNYWEKIKTDNEYNIIRIENSNESIKEYNYKGEIKFESKIDRYYNRKIIYIHKRPFEYTEIVINLNDNSWFAIEWENGRIMIEYNNKNEFFIGKMMK